MVVVAEEAAAFGVAGGYGGALGAAGAVVAFLAGGDGRHQEFFAGGAGQCLRVTFLAGYCLVCFVTEDSGGVEALRLMRWRDGWKRLGLVGGGERGANQFGRGWCLPALHSVAEVAFFAPQDCF